MGRPGRKFGTALQPSLLTLESPVPRVGTVAPAQPVGRPGRKFGTALQPSLLTLESPVPQVGTVAQAQPVGRPGRKFGTALQPSLLTLESPVPQVLAVAFVGHFALLDPDPDSEYGSGFTDPIESGSNWVPDRQP